MAAGPRIQMDVVVRVASLVLHAQRRCAARKGCMFSGGSCHSYLCTGHIRWRIRFVYSLAGTSDSFAVLATLM